MRTPRIVHTATLVLVVAVTASCGGSTGKNEQAFCDAVKAGDAAAARTLLAGEGFNVWARNARGDCQPLKAVFDQATPKSPEFTAMALELLQIPGGLAHDVADPEQQPRGTVGHGLAAHLRGRQWPRMPLVRAIIAAGVDIRDTQGRAALTDAVYGAPPELVRAMIEGGANPQWMLGTAIVTRRHDLMAYAESKGAREDQPAVLVAARRGDLAALDAVIAQKADLEVKDRQGLTPIMRAAVFDHPEAVARLGTGWCQRESHDGRQRLRRGQDRAAPGRWTGKRARRSRRSSPRARTSRRARTRGGRRPSCGRSPKAQRRACTSWSWRGPRAGLQSRRPAGALLRGGTGPSRHGARLVEGRRPPERAHRRGLEPPLHVALAHCGKLADGSGSDADFHVDLLRALVDAGADRSAKDGAGLTPVEAAAKRLADATHPYCQALLSGEGGLPAIAAVMTSAPACRR